MGFLNDMKKLLFGVKSVGKSAAEKAVEAGKEAGSEFLERSGNVLHEAKEKTGAFLDHTFEKAQETGKNIAEKAGDLVHKAVEKAEDLFDKAPGEESLSEPAPPPPAQKAPEADPSKPLDFAAVDNPDELELKPVDKSSIQKIGGKVIDTTLEAGKKVEQAAEDLGHKALEAGEVAAEKFKEAAEVVGSKVIEKGGELWERAKEFGSHLLHKAEEAAKKAHEEGAKEKDLPGTMDELIQKAKDLGDKFEEKAQDTSRQFTDSLKDAKASDLTKHDDFFEKAKRFADGDYQAASSNPVIGKDPNYKPVEKEGKTHGFEDGDNDGNDLIDDATIIDEKP